jgi:hypothetical protein
MTDPNQIASKDVKALRVCIAEMADALSVADSVISVNCGIDTPPEWDRALRAVSKKRAAVRAIMERDSNTK